MKISPGTCHIISILFGPSHQFFFTKQVTFLSDFIYRNQGWQATTCSSKQKHATHATISCHFLNPVSHIFKHPTPTHATIFLMVRETGRDIILTKTCQQFSVYSQTRAYLYFPSATMHLPIPFMLDKGNEIHIFKNRKIPMYFFCTLIFIVGNLLWRTNQFFPIINI